ncbi:hypothetical protein [Streptomyces megasporus]|uniref:hypothetical protein n=1 Tax=Streptomyces megasporus TaxID=44060 RepID=UPI0004E0D68A|nr:hypothetical protein [Streptomyces megasporus]
MRKRTARTVLPVALLCGTFALAACGEDGGNNELTGAAVRTAAAQAGEAAFEQAGHPIDGGLDCADEGSGENLRITCDGKTRDGQDARMTATADRNPEINTGDGVRIEGFEVVGTVGNNQVIKKKGCVGVGC